MDALLFFCCDFHILFRICGQTVTRESLRVLALEISIGVLMFQQENFNFCITIFIHKFQPENSYVFVFVNYLKSRRHNNVFVFFALALAKHKLSSDKKWRFYYCVFSKLEKNINNRKTPIIFCIRLWHVGYKILSSLRSCNYKNEAGILLYWTCLWRKKKMLNNNIAKIKSL